MSLLAILYFIIGGLPCPAWATNSQHTFKKEGSRSPGEPVTNASVEAGLRQTREALRRTPEFQRHDPETHMRLATLLNQQGDPNGAIEEYLAAIRLKPDWAEAYRDLGSVHIDKHEWEAAITALRQSTRLDEEDGQSWYWLGRALMANQDFSDATRAFRRATKVLPDEVEAYSDLGLVLMAQGRSAEADEVLTRAITLRPDFAEAHHRLEQLRSTQRDKEQVIQAADKILNILFRRN